MISEVDISVGKKIRTRRTLLGLSQTDLASKLGITFQQVQKYERGKNRVGASRLYGISQVLGVSVSYFFTDPISETTLITNKKNPEPTQNSFLDGNLINNRDILEFIKAYYKISEPTVRKRVADLIKSLSTV